MFAKIRIISIIDKRNWKQLEITKRKYEVKIPRNPMDENCKQNKHLRMAWDGTKTKSTRREESILEI